MANIDLSSYKLGDLKTLQRDVENAIKDRQQEEVQKARDQILAIAKDAGVSVEELVGTTAKKVEKGKGQKARPQYQNPEESSQTWTGRGRKPRWITEALANGKNLIDLRIK